MTELTITIYALKLRSNVVLLTVKAGFNFKIIDFRGEKIENPHMGDYRHIDMFSRIESARLENYKNTFKRSNFSGKFGKINFGV